MSRFHVMPRAYRRQLQAADQAAVDRATQHQDDPPEGSAGILRGIPAIGKGCPGHIRDTDPGGKLLRSIRTPR
jgi:hypothetical protein